MEDFVLSQKMWFVQHSNIPPQKILNVPIYYEGFIFFWWKITILFFTNKTFPFLHHLIFVCCILVMTIVSHIENPCTYIYITL